MYVNTTVFKVTYLRGKNNHISTRTHRHGESFSVGRFDRCGETVSDVDSILIVQCCAQDQDQEYFPSSRQKTVVNMSNIMVIKQSTEGPEERL